MIAKVEIAIIIVEENGHRRTTLYEVDDVRSMEMSEHGQSTHDEHGTMNRWLPSPFAGSYDAILKFSYRNATQKGSANWQPCNCHDCVAGRNQRRKLEHTLAELRRNEDGVKKDIDRLESEIRKLDS